MVDDEAAEDNLVSDVYRTNNLEGRPKHDSEDSSYDSDYENSDPLLSPSGCHDAQHEEVGRTISDTLAAEFAEYVQVSENEPESGVVKIETAVGDNPVSYQNYANQIEFALKLGYTEKQAQLALHKLGPKAEQNELLAELIKLGANSRIEFKNQQVENNSQLSTSKSDLTCDVEGSALRHVVIDGSNVAMSHGNKEVFSCRGIKLCIDWFKTRGHKDITVFVPMWRKEASRPDAIIKDQEVLWELEKERVLVFTPSRQMGGRRMACHDDRYILKLAAETDGIVVSNDNYRDLLNESPEYKRVVEGRLLMYSFVNDRFMPPDDPLGRHGPSLDAFLRMPPKLAESCPPCPYGKKCTYGNKCKYYHPERGNQPHKSVSEQLAEQAKIHIQEVKSRNKVLDSVSDMHKLKESLSSPLPGSRPIEKAPIKNALQRTKSLLVPSLALPPSTEYQPAHSSTEEEILEGRQRNEQPEKHEQPSTLTWKGDFSRVQATPPSSPPPHTMPTWSSPFYEDGGNHLAVAKRLSDPDNRKRIQGEGVNLHRKLQRQLTLNPNCDPRLVRMRSFIGQQQQPGLGSDVENATTLKVQEHTPLTRHNSAGSAEGHLHQHWNPYENVHQTVTRIASAPDSYHQWRSHASYPQCSTSSSDTQLHQFESSPYVWGGAAQRIIGSAAPPLPHTGQNMTWQNGSVASFPGSNNMVSPSRSSEDQRKHLYFHLASVFPEEQVRAAMEIHPKETNPQAICATILSMFHKPK